MTSLESSDLDERVVTKAALDTATAKLSSLCATHAPTFVAVERRSTLLASSLSTLLSSVDALSPQVTLAASSLETKNSSSSLSGNDSIGNSNITTASSLALLAERHRIRRRTLLQHSSLLELLELPSLMDACVRSNLYEEALNISTFANTLERRHASDGYKVVENVVKEVRTREMDLRRHLLKRLRGDMTMPQCLEVVTALRRLNGVELERRSQHGPGTEDVEKVHGAMEMRLQVDFFEARDAWLETFGGQEGLLDTIERYRTRCFEIATQFLAIFRAEGLITGSVTKGTHNLSLLSLWTTRRVQIFLSVLQRNLHKVNDMAGLRDVLDATLFFSTSMGRIGADFQSLLPPIFEQRLVEIVKAMWAEAVKTLQKTLLICRDTGVATPLYTDAIPTMETVDTEENIRTPLPPRQLLSFPPMARFLNSFLAGLNELRRCLLVGTFSRLRDEMDIVVHDVRAVLTTNERAVLTPGLKGEAAKLREVAKEMKDLFDMCVEPYCRMSLEVALGLFELKSMEEQEPQEDEKDDGEEKDKKDDDEEDTVVNVVKESEQNMHKKDEDTSKGAGDDKGIQKQEFGDEQGLHESDETKEEEIEKYD